MSGVRNFNDGLVTGRNWAAEWQKPGRNPAWAEGIESLREVAGHEYQPSGYSVYYDMFPEDDGNAGLAQEVYESWFGTHRMPTDDFLKGFVEGLLEAVESPTA